MKALELQGVTAGYGRTVVLRDVDLVVPAGKTIALLGANGAGKTTLLNVIAGDVAPSKGNIWLQRDRMDLLPGYLRARSGLCLIPEGRALFRQLTVRENLAMYCNGRRLAEAVDRAATAFPVLGRRLDQEAGTLSGGEQQMLAFSRALVVDAKVVMADELSMGLAPIVVDEIFRVVEQLGNEGRSLLIVEQFVSRALAVADYVYVLHRGRVVFVGEPQQCAHDQVFDQYMGIGGPT